MTEPDIKFVHTTLAKNEKLVLQYYKVRQARMIADGAKDYKPVLSSDAGKSFLLAVKDAGSANPKVLAGFRFSEIHEGQDPPGKLACDGIIKQAELESIFPNYPGNIRDMNVLYIDGAMMEKHADVSHELIDALTRAAIDFGSQKDAVTGKPKYKFVYFVPEWELALTLERVFNEDGYKEGGSYKHFGPVSYTSSHSGKEKTKPMIGFMNDESLKQHVRPDPPELRPGPPGSKPGQWQRKYDLMIKHVDRHRADKQPHDAKEGLSNASERSAPEDGEPLAFKGQPKIGLGGKLRTGLMSGVRGIGHGVRGIGERMGWARSVACTDAPAVEESPSL